MSDLSSDTFNLLFSLTLIIYQEGGAQHNFFFLLYMFWGMPQGWHQMLSQNLPYAWMNKGDLKKSFSI